MKRTFAKIYRHLRFVAGIAFLFQNPAFAEFQIEKVTVDEDDYSYGVSLPNQYDPTVKWPLIVYLHGAGERGEDPLKVAQVGLYPVVEQSPELYQAIVIMPQIRKQMTWVDAIAKKIALSAIQHSISEFKVDVSRIYLTGYSMGGRGAWELSLESPDLFAAIVPVAASRVLDWSLLAKISKKPVWIAHGTADLDIPIQVAKRAKSELEKQGNGNVIFKTYPTNHEKTATAAYSDPKLAEWLMSQSQQ